jgi:lipoprotein-anchoring transpeptidase ErfK/SrfK
MTWTTRRAVTAVWSVMTAAVLLPVANAQADACSDLPGGAPGPAAAWRAELSARTAVYDRLPKAGGRASRRVSPNDAPWLLVLGPPRAAGDRCWLRVRLPSRPNQASGWVDAAAVAVEQTPWRIDVVTRRRTLNVYRAGARIRSIRVVVGTRGTPTPVGLFAVTWAIRWHPHDFLGSWVLEVTAHSNVLQHFDGGDGRVAIHGRGGNSFLDPLGSARSRGCIRMSNDAIDWLVRTIGADDLPGTPVNVRD